MITQRRQTYASHVGCGFRFSRCLYVFISIQKLLKGSLQPELEGASVWSFNAGSKVPTG